MGDWVRFRDVFSTTNKQDNCIKDIAIGGKAYKTWTNLAAAGAKRYAFTAFLVISRLSELLG